MKSKGTTRLTRVQLERFANTAMAQWDRRYGRMDSIDRNDTERHAAAMAERFARTAAYISRRMIGGTHADAVKHQNAVARGVRKALGFAYPNQPITF